MTRRVLILDLPAECWPGELLNANRMRGHSRDLARAIAPWRDLGALVARGVAPVPTPARVWLEVTLPTNQRRDASNLAPTGKALVDGLVDAGVLPDDCDGVIEGPHVRRTYPNGPARLRVIVEPIAPDDLGRPYEGRSS